MSMKRADVGIVLFQYQGCGDAPLATPRLVESIVLKYSRERYTHAHIDKDEEVERLRVDRKNVLFRLLKMSPCCKGHIADTRASGSSLPDLVLSRRRASASWSCITFGSTHRGWRLPLLHPVSQRRGNQDCRKYNRHDCLQGNMV